MPRLHGEQHYARKLTDEAVRSIRAAYIPGAITHAELGQQYGVSKQTIAKVLNGYSWKHIPTDQPQRPASGLPLAN